MPIGRASLFLIGGISNGIKLSEQNTMHSESYYYSITHTDDSKAISEIRTFQQSFELGVSLMYSRFYLEGRYESSNGIAPFTALGSSPKTLYLLLGFRII
jgi:hypothetical protein